MAWLLNVVYLLLLAALSPLLVYRLAAQGKYRDGWREKLLGRLPRRDSDRPCLWFHAVSVGEVLQLRPVLAALAVRRPDVEVVITTTTSTGLAVARETYPDCRVCYCPLDFTWAVRQAIRRVRPTAIVLVELELWPNMIFAARRAGIGLALINGRISRRSFRGYRRVRFLIGRLLRGFDVLAAQTPDYAERLAALGASAERVQVTGSIKFDGVQSDRRNPRTEEIRRSFGLRDADRVFVAGSTQAPEEEYALRTWQALRRAHPGLRLILVPRHRERFEEVAALVRREGVPLVRRSELAHRADSGATHKTPGSVPSPNDLSPLSRAGAAAPVFLLDTIGELGACWGLAEVAFVGGSLTRRGGQNMIEPAAYGAAVLFGPNTWNFRDVVDLLLSHNAARVVHDADQLTAAVGELLADPEFARAQGRTARELVLSQQGAAEATVRAVLGLLPAAPAARPGPAGECRRVA